MSQFLRGFLREAQKFLNETSVTVSNLGSSMQGEYGEVATATCTGLRSHKGKLPGEPTETH